ncbi:helix-turn-helix transcriptional regulator [Bifidobacterium sp. ESL0775]|uniref:response regulator transcription factor n=1 Tax=Bifidobacterium sp. ESL0775 TaxID=2983230 RepID=UPI0023F9B6EE|nr:helix-turn-helix transcriptional regulator [Bifidobacterium sp. ESL0775]WEV69701.1 helix-turn-helix transcriptional regulator [Bifidobacterium sp. ESL0775]
MREKISSQRRELHIVLIDDDPCALRYEKIILSRLQNRNGCHVKVWGTIKLEDGIQKSLYDFHPADVVIIDMSLKERSKRNIFHEIKEVRSDIIIIGITSHIEKYLHPVKLPSQVRCILNKAKLNQELPRIIDAIYQEKTPRHRSSLEKEDNEPPLVCCDAEICQRLSCASIKTCRLYAIKRHKNSDLTAETEISNAMKDLTRNAKLRRNRSSTPLQKRSQRSDIFLRTANQRKRTHNLSACKPESHDLAETLKDMNAHDQPTLPSVPLTPTELKIVRLSVVGLKPCEVAKRLGISVGTVYSHRSHIMSKYQAKNWVDALLICQQKNGTG